MTLMSLFKVTILLRTFSCMQLKVLITVIVISSTRNKTNCELDQILTVFTLNNRGIYTIIYESQL